MPMFTRSSQKQQEEDDRINPLSKMGEKEEKPFRKWQEKQTLDHELTNEMLKKAKKDPQFQLDLDKILELNKDK
jgi:hypothetical protein